MSDFSESGVSANISTTKLNNSSSAELKKDDNAISEESVVSDLVAKFPKGLSEGLIIKKLCDVYNISSSDAKKCYQEALDRVAVQKGESKDKENDKTQSNNNLDNNPLAGANSGENKTDAMNNLNALGSYNKMMFDLQGGASTQGGD